MYVFFPLMERPPKLLCLWLFAQRYLQRGCLVFWFHTSIEQFSVLMAPQEALPCQRGKILEYHIAVPLVSFLFLCVCVINTNLFLCGWCLKLGILQQSQTNAEKHSLLMTLLKVFLVAYWSKDNSNVQFDYCKNIKGKRKLQFASCETRFIWKIARSSP